MTSTIRNEHMPGPKRCARVRDVPNLPGYEWATESFLRHAIFDAEDRVGSGGTVTLAMLPKRLRTKFKKALKASEPTWWNTHELWKQWPSLISELGLSSGHMPTEKLS